MISFSPSRKSFFDSELNYSNLPDDLIEISNEKHYELLFKINQGCVIFEDLTTSPPPPSEFHIWSDGVWVDNRTDEEKEKDRLSNFIPLKRRQFMRALVISGFDLDQIEATINLIEDTQTRQLALIDWKDATEFERTDETLLMMADMLGLTNAQIDSMWELGLTL